MAYRIISDGSCDLADALAAEKNVVIVPFYVTMDEKTYLKEGVEITKDDFYQWMVDNPTKFPRSSTPSVQDYLDAFTEAAEAGEDIICICITTKFSSSWSVANMAKRMLEEQYPNIRVAVINSMVNTVLQGLFVLEAARLRDSGVGFEECVSRLEKVRPTGRILFTVGSMDYLRIGGRIGKLASIAGSFLGIRPLITLKEGEIFPSGISRVRSKSLEKVLNLAINYISSAFKAVEDYTIVIGYGYDYNEALAFRDKLIARLGEIGHRTSVPIRHIGAAISVHTGPYPLGIAVLGKG